MDNKKEINNFPSDFVPQKEKTKEPWLLQAAKAAHQYGWNRFIGTQEGNRNKFKLFRRYAEGTEPTDKFKNMVQGEGNTAELALIYDIDSPLPTFVQNIVGQLQNQAYKPQIQAISPETSTEYDRKRNELKANRLLAKKAEDLKKVGVDVEKYVKKEEVFQTDEEIEIHLEMNFKDDLSMALEIATAYVLDKNRYPVLERKLIRDLVVCGQVFLKVEYDTDLDIVVRYVDPVNLTYDTVEQEDFSDAKWMGEYRYVTIDQLAVMAGDQLTEEQLFECALNNKDNRGNGWDSRWGTKYYPELINDGRPYGGFKIEILDLEVKSFDKYRGEWFKDDRSGQNLFKPANKTPRKEDSQFVEKTIENIYKCKFITGTEYIIDYGIKTNIPRDKEGELYYTNADFGFIGFAPDIYDMVNKSIVGKLINTSDQYKLLSLHEQRVIAEAHPAGVAVDMAAVAAAVNGMGEKNLRPRDLINIFRKTGTFVYSSQVHGKPINNQKPIQDIPESTLVALNQLQAKKQALVAEMEMATGVPYSTIGTPDKDTLVGTAKLASVNRNNALRYLNTAYKDVLNRATKTICRMVQDRIDDGKKIEDYGMAIGYGNVDTIKISKRIPLCDLGITIKTAPDGDEQEALLQILNNSLSNGQIKPSDAAIVRRISQQNVELAERYLKVWEKKYADEKNESALMNTQAQSQAQAQAAMAIEKSKQQTLQVEYQLKMQYLQMEYRLKYGESNIDHQEKMKEIVMEGEMKNENIETAMEGGQRKEGGETEYSELGLPKSSGVRLPSVSTGTKPNV